MSRRGREGTRLTAASLLLSALAAHSLLAAGGGPSPESRGLQNGGFEAGAEGSPEGGWFMPSPLREAGHAFTTTGWRPFAGKRCAELSREPGNLTGDFANVMQTVDARPYRGKVVRLTAAVRVESEGPGDRAQLWMRVDRTRSRTGFFDNMNDRPILNAEWARYEIVGDVAEDAETINVGLMLFGGARAFLDDVTLDVVGSASASVEPPRPLTSRGLAHLSAFARLIGYVRYFHPSDEAEAADWERIVLEGVPAVESADSPPALATALETLFRPVAPSVRVVPDGEKFPALDFGLSAGNGDDFAIVSWHHLGLGTSGKGSVFRSERVEREPDGAVDPSRDGAMDLYRVVDPEPYRGKRLRLTASLRVDGASGAGEAKLGLAVARPGKPLAYESGESASGTVPPAWREASLEVDVPDDASLINLGVHVTGRASVGFDAVRLDVRDESGWRRVEALDFENAELDADPLGWKTQATRGLVRYEAGIAEGPARSGTRYASITGRRDSELELPDPRRPLVVGLPGGVTARVPVALYKDDRGTLPRAKPPEQERLDGDVERTWRTGRDRTTRLAAAVLGWNVFQHFYPYFDDVETDWSAVLATTLERAAVDADERAFLDTLRQMIAALHDGHGRVRHSSDDDVGVPPVLWEEVEDRPVVTHVEHGPSARLGLAPGDEILAVDGRPVDEIARERAALISSPTQQWRRHRLYRTLLAGEPESSLTLTVRSPGGEPRTVKAARTTRLGEVREKRPAPVQEQEPGLYYVDLTRVSEATLSAVIPDLAEAEGVVFDVRGYPRVSTKILAHLTEETVRSPQWRVPVLRYPDRERMEYHESSWPVAPLTPKIGGRVAFLTDGRAISYAETMLGIVEAYRLGEIVGSATAGTNGNINPFTLPGGYFVTWTGMKVLKHDGSRHHGVGIRPTVPAGRTIAGVAAGRDEVLERGFEVVRRAPSAR